MNNSDFKQNALNRLNGNWGKVIGITAIILVLSLLSEAIKIWAIFLIIVEIPLYYGITMSFYKIYKGEETKFFDFWNDGFNNFLRSWGISWRIFLKMLIPIIIMIISYFILGASIVANGVAMINNLDNDYYDDDYNHNYKTNKPLDNYDNDDNYDDNYDNDDNYNNNYYNYKKYNYNSTSSSDLNNKNVKVSKLSSIKSSNSSTKRTKKSSNSPVAIILCIISVIIIITCIIWLIPISYSYKFANLIAIEHPEMSTKEAVDLSKRIMDGNRMNLFILELSFIGWAILATFTAGIGYLWLIPYRIFTSFGFYESLTSQPTPDVEIQNDNNNQF